MTDLLVTYLGEEAPIQLANIGLMFVGWNILNYIVMSLDLNDKHLTREDFLDLRNRISSVVHGVISLFFAAYNTYFLHSQCGAPNTAFESFTLSFSASYFLYDFIAMGYYGILDKSMTIHHNICIFGMTMSVVSGQSANSLVAALFVSEISNPAMHVRMMLKHLNRRYTKAYECAELTYICKILSASNLLSQCSTCTEDSSLECQSSSRPSAAQATTSSLSA
jgi:hypothetical protein